MGCHRNVRLNNDLADQFIAFGIGPTVPVRYITIDSLSCSVSAFQLVDKATDMA